MSIHLQDYTRPGLTLCGLDYERHRRAFVDLDEPMCRICARVQAARTRERELAAAIAPHMRVAHNPRASWARRTAALKAIQELRRKPK